MRAKRNIDEKEVLRLLVEGNGFNEKWTIKAIQEAKEKGGAMTEGASIEYVQYTNTFSVIF